MTPAAGLGSVWGRAADELGTITWTVRIAGLDVRFEVAGQAMLDVLVPALRHHPGHRDAVPAPQLVVRVADRREAALPAAPASAHAEPTRDDSSDRTHLRRWAPDIGLATELDLVDSVAIVVVDDARRLPWWERAAPLRHLLGLWAATHDRWLIHAAGLEANGHAVLLAGPGGSGKSTAALHAALRGWGFFGDDYVVVDLSSHDAPVVSSLYATGKVVPNEWEQLPTLHPMLLGAGDDHPRTPKAVVDLGRCPLIRFADPSPLGTILLPEVTSTRSRSWQPATAGEALRALAPSTVLQMPGAGSSWLAASARLVRSVPVRRVQFSHDRNDAPALIAEASGSAPAAVDAVGPRVSVIVPVFDGEPFLGAALDSIVDEGWPALDLIVVDDGSHDPDAIARIAAPRGARLICRPNGGVAAARNTALRFAIAEFVAFCDQDDLRVPGVLHQQIDHLRARPAVAGVLGRQLVFADGDHDLPDWTRLDPRVDPSDELLPLTMLVRRTVLDELGFDETLSGSDDFDLLVRMRRNGHLFERLDLDVIRRRIHRSNQSHDRATMVANRFRLLRNAAATHRTAATTA
jgi:GT2 family glycosyltransferase